MNIQNALDKILALCEKAETKGKTSWEWKGWLKEPIDPDDPADVCIPYILKEGLVYSGVKNIIAELRKRGLQVFYDDGYDWHQGTRATLKVSWKKEAQATFLSPFV